MSETDTDTPDSKPQDASKKPPTKTPAKGQRPLMGELDESKIDAPSKQTLIMLGVICISTLVMWAAGRAACNYSVPGESLTPRKVSLEERTRTPKDAGIELAQAVSTADFQVAQKLTLGEALKWVKAEEKSCGDCQGRRNSHPLSVGTVLEANAKESIVQVRTVRGETGEQLRFFLVERELKDWRVTRVFSSREKAHLAPTPKDQTKTLGAGGAGNNEDEKSGEHPRTGRRPHP